MTILGSETISYANTQHGLIEILDDIILHLQSYRKTVSYTHLLLHLDNLFDTLVTADRITQGKPDPMCYLLAAKDLNVSPEDCIVFEDSFNGIQSGKDAGMRVIGLSTTNPAESLRDKVYEVIPNFEKVTFEDYLRW